MTGFYLIDKSAYTRRRQPAVEAAISTLIVSNQAATCEIIALELLYSARNLSDYERISRDLHALRWLTTTTTVLTAALELQHSLAQRGQHRLPIPDLIIAATAAEHNAVLLHYDRDFELIAAITGQAQEWVVPAGSID